MTREEVCALRVGDYVQEMLGSAHGGRYAKWGRPRRVSEVLKKWVTARGKACVHFKVEFASMTLSWTAIENRREHRVVSPRPSAADLQAWKDGAELCPLTFDIVDPHPIRGDGVRHRGAYHPGEGVSGEMAGK